MLIYRHFSILLFTFSVHCSAHFFFYIKSTSDYSCLVSEFLDLVSLDWGFVFHCSVAQLCPMFCDAVDCSMFLALFTMFQELTQTHAH